MKRIIFVLSVVLGLYSCKQQDLKPPGNASPVYIFEGNVGADTVLMEAGNNNLYMYTNYEVDSLGLTTLMANLRAEGNPNAEPHLELLLNANKKVGNTYVYSNDFWNANTFIPSNSSDFTQTSGYQVILTATNANQVLTHAWYDDAVLLGAGATQLQTYTQGGSKTFTYITNSSGGIFDSVTQTVVLNSNMSFDNIVINNVNTLQGSVSASCGGVTGTRTWQWGDGAVSNGASATHTYASSGTYTITLIQNNGGDTHYARQVITLDTASYRLAPSFAIDVTNSGQSGMRVNLNSAIINWYKNNTVYSSYIANSSDQSTKPVIKIKSYLAGPNNEKGQKTLLLNCDADVWLYNRNNTSDSMRLTSKAMVLGVAVP
ncbi:MAG: hypothetical protein RL660_986 [Bacteroidota bacterium]|jgi:hypothetical protein